MDTVHNSSLDNSYSRNAALDDDVDDDNHSKGHMDILDVDEFDLDQFVAELLHVVALLALDDKRTVVEIRGYVAGVCVFLMHVVWVKLCLAVPLDLLRLNFLVLLQFDCFPLQMNNFSHQMDLNRVKIQWIFPLCSVQCWRQPSFRWALAAMQNNLLNSLCVSRKLSAKIYNFIFQFINSKFKFGIFFLDHFNFWLYFFLFLVETNCNFIYNWILYVDAHAI